MEKLYTREWKPAGSPRAFLLLVHGYAEHVGRYARFAGQLSEAGIHVLGYDHRGHGLSPGKRGEVADFSGLVDDLEGQVEAAACAVGELPLFLMGHSMGGLVSANFLATRPHSLAGAIISSPLLAIPEGVPAWKLGAADWLGRWLPWLPVENLDAAGISRDAAEVAAYRSDPLVYHGRINARTGAALVSGIRATTAAVPRITLPILVLHGTADGLAPFAGGERLYAGAGSTDKTCLWEDGGYHELLNDLNRTAAETAIMAWLDSQVAGAGPELPPR